MSGIPLISWWVRLMALTGRSKTHIWRCCNHLIYPRQLHLEPLTVGQLLHDGISCIQIAIAETVALLRQWEDGSILFLVISILIIYSESGRVSIMNG